MSDKKTSLLLGSHISIAGGIQKSFERGEAIGCSCMQIFTKSNRQWQAKPLTQETIELFKITHNKSLIKDVVVHASYLINIGAPNQTIEKLSIEALTIELERVKQLGLTYLVLHPGACLNFSEAVCLNRIATNLDRVLDTISGNTMILLENMAGQGSTMGSTFNQLASIRNKAHHKHRIGFCFDTCHAFAAGYDFQTPATYKDLWEQFDTIIGLDHLKAIHLNDSQKPLESHVDRHAHIGKGKIAEEAFSLLINDSRFVHIPKILETPIIQETDYIKDFTILVNLLTPDHLSWINGLKLQTYRKN